MKDPVQIISIDSIAIQDNRQRKFFPEAEMEELKASILTEKGLMQPILVRPDGNGYILVAGERRLKTVKTIKKQYHFGDHFVDPGFIPAVIKNFTSDLEAKEAELHENIIRLGLTWQEKAQAIADLHEYQKMKDPRHKVGMTARMIEEGDNDGDYAMPKTYQEVQSSLLVSDFLNDPDVSGAKTLKQARTVVSRKLEEEQLMKMRELLKATVKETVHENLDLPDLPELPDEEDKQDYNGIFYEGDMRELMAKVEDGSVNLVITDPPYGMGVADHKDAGGVTLGHEYSEENAEELNLFLIKELDRVCAKDAHVYIFCDIDMFPSLRGAFSEEWRVRRTPLVWYKGVRGFLADGTAQGYKRSFEFILYATRGMRPGSMVSSDVINVPAQLNKVHAAQKPPELYFQLMRMSAIPGDTVLDPFAGTGPVFSAAYRSMVRPIGIEMNEKFATMCDLERMGISGGKDSDDDIPF